MKFDEPLPHRHSNLYQFPQVVDVFERIMDDVPQIMRFGFDLETSGFNWWGDDWIVGIGIGIYSEGIIETWYVPIGHASPFANVERTRVLSLLKPMFQHPEIAKVGANTKFDAHFMRVAGVEVNNVEDVQVLARLLRSDYMKVSLDSLMDKEYGCKHAEWEVLVKWCRAHKLKVSKSNVAPKAYAYADPEVLGNYCGADVYWTMMLDGKFNYELKQNPNLHTLYRGIEKPLIQEVIEIEEQGVEIDVPYLQRMREGLIAATNTLEKAVYEEAGQIFNLRSAKQLKEVLIPMGVIPEERERKNKEGVVKTPSLDKTTLNKYRHLPIVDNLLKYRELYKFLNTYVISMLEKLETPTGYRRKIYTSLRQESARTGRFGCADPNLQNIPKDGEDATWSIRKAFIPREPTNNLFTIDYVAMEYRMLAHFCMDEQLVHLFKESYDFHTYVGEKIFDTDDLSKKQRSIAKTFNFAQLYGAGPTSISEKLGISLKECQELFHEYNVQFDGVAKWKRTITNKCKKERGVRNIFGRWRRIEPAMSYTAVNTLIQGTCADVVKLAILRVQKFLRNKSTKLLFPVHDELVFDSDTIDGKFWEEVMSLMTDFPNKKGTEIFRIPLEVELTLCRDNWAEGAKVTDMVPEVFPKSIGEALAKGRSVIFTERKDVH